MLSDAKFQRLVTDVGRILTAAKNHATVDGKLVESYWHVGKRIVRTGALDDDSYGQAVMQGFRCQTPPRASASHRTAPASRAEQRRCPWEESAVSFPSPALSSRRRGPTTCGTST